MKNQINIIEFTGKIGALVAEEMKNVGVILQDLPTEKREILSNTLLLASEMLRQTMRELLDESSH